MSIYTINKYSICGVIIGLGFRVREGEWGRGDQGIRCQGSGIRDKACKYSGSGLHGPVIRSQVSGIRFSRSQAPGIRLKHIHYTHLYRRAYMQVQGYHYYSGITDQESGIRSQVSGLRDQESGLRSQGSGIRFSRSQVPDVRGNLNVQACNYSGSGLHRSSSHLTH